jgi:type II secretory pathway pseudopilin PulG
MVESIMAMFIVVILFVGVATTLQIAVRQQRELRLQQQAAALALEYVEFARSLTWEELALDDSPPTGTPHVSGSDLEGAAFDLSGDEELVVDTANGLITAANVGGETINGQVFDVYHYVTDADTGLRRVVVLIEWQSRNLSHDYFTTTLVSELGAG